MNMNTNAYVSNCSQLNIVAAIILCSTSFVRLLIEGKRNSESFVLGLEIYVFLGAIEKLIHNVFSVNSRPLNVFDDRSACLCLAQTIRELGGTLS